MLKLNETGFEGLFIVEPRIFPDDRGYFFESYNHANFNKIGIDTKFVQDNESKSTYGVIRGLHFQLPPFAQTKLVRVVYGKIIDIALDLRRNSKTFGTYYAVELSDLNKRQFYIPQGFAHGFSVISDIAIVNYKCDNYYAKESEGGINPMDSRLNIDWQIVGSKQIISEKDAISKPFNPSENYF